MSEFCKHGLRIGGDFYAWSKYELHSHSLLLGSVTPSAHNGIHVYSQQPLRPWTAACLQKLYLSFAERFRSILFDVNIANITSNRRRDFQKKQTASQQSRQRRMKEVNTENIARIDIIKNTKRKDGARAGWGVEWWNGRQWWRYWTWIQFQRQRHQSTNLIPHYFIKRLEI